MSQAAEGRQSYLKQLAPAAAAALKTRRSGRLELSGRTVFITGAGSGIGAAIARGAYQHGASVVLVDVHTDQLEQACSTFGSRGLPITVDVTDAAALDQAVGAAVDRFGSVDVCIANAGIAASQPVTIAKTSTAEFERIIEVDLLGVWRTVRACLPHVIDVRGHVLVTSSIYAFINGAANAPYAMSKAAVESFGRSLRAELAGTGATAGVLYPGWVDTPIIAASHQHNSPSQQLLDLFIPGALRAPISPESVSSAVVDGIRRRKARITVPRRWSPVSAGRGLVNIATDAVFDHHPRAHQLLGRI